MTDIIIPTAFPYPKISKIEKVKELHGKFCYVVEKYPLQGIALTILRKDGNICIQMTDFSGNKIGPENNKHQNCIDTIMTTIAPRIMLTMKLSGINQATFYFSNYEEPILVDVRVSLNKFCGPGFISDIFGKQKIPVQNIIGDPLNLDEDGFELIRAGKGIYSKGKFILKPSAFKTIIRGNDVFPAYGILINETKSAT